MRPERLDDGVERRASTPTGWVTLGELMGRVPRGAGPPGTPTGLSLLSRIALALACVALMLVGCVIGGALVVVPDPADPASSLQASASADPGRPALEGGPPPTGPDGASSGAGRPEAGQPGAGKAGSGLGETGRTRGTEPATALAPKAGAAPAPRAVAVRQPRPAGDGHRSRPAPGEHEAADRAGAGPDPYRGSESAESDRDCAEDDPDTDDQGPDSREDDADTGDRPRYHDDPRDDDPRDDDEHGDDDDGHGGGLLDDTVAGLKDTVHDVTDLLGGR